MSLLQSFIDRVEKFLTRYEMAPSQLGKLALNDPSFVLELRRGRKPNPDLIDRVDAFMREHRAAAKAARKNSDTGSEPERRLAG